MVALAARELGLPPDVFSVAESNTNTIPNRSSTGASTGTDLAGGAVQSAARQLRLRLLTFMKDLQADEHHNWPAIFRAVWNGERDCFDQDVSTGQDHFVRGAPWQDNWAALVHKAYFARENLSSQAQYATPNFGGILKDTTKGDGYWYVEKSADYYRTYSAAAAEVEIDVLTGEFEVLRVDILFDAGKQIVRNIHLGQIEGRSMQYLQHML